MNEPPAACSDEPFDWVFDMDAFLLFHYHTGGAVKVSEVVVSYKSRGHSVKHFVHYRPMNSQAEISAVHNRLPHPSLYSILQFKMKTNVKIDKGRSHEW